MSTPWYFLSVQCRACGAGYQKPKVRNTVRANPGCPECGALGWMPANGELTAGAAPRRSGGGLRPLRHGRAG